MQKMTLIDTHCHIDYPDYDHDRDQMIERANTAGIAHMIAVGVDPETNARVYELSKKYSSCVSATVGFHPHSIVDCDSLAFMNGLDALIAKNKPVALGEVGLDYYKCKADPAAQKALFAELIRAALRHNLPLVVHSREAFVDTFEIMKREGGGKLKAVFHCYSYDTAALRQILNEGWMVSFTCNVTYKNVVNLLNAAIEVPLDRLMLETDAPYLSPQSKRGQRNEPANVAELALFLAGKRAMTVERLAEQTTRNAVNFFGPKLEGQS